MKDLYHLLQGTKNIKRRGQKDYKSWRTAVKMLVSPPMAIAVMSPQYL